MLALYRTEFTLSKWTLGVFLVPHLHSSQTKSSHPLVTLLCFWFPVLQSSFYQNRSLGSTEIQMSVMFTFPSHSLSMFLCQVLETQEQRKESSYFVSTFQMSYINSQVNMSLKNLRVQWKRQACK